MAKAAEKWKNLLKCGRNKRSYVFNTIALKYSFTNTKTLYNTKNQLFHAPVRVNHEVNLKNYPG